ncbi:iron-containing redox enzyme family protein [Massilia sp. CF038]|uniref:iron-containing redox enzyme family protein n=1 Tax=Massilia sp. CF038 TaxID=1881045 RepID=UPI000A3FCEE3|nr:iron-containing redox enzyme family protein [Massilia sp. CF038]
MALLDNPAASADAAPAFLREQIRAASVLPADLPDDFSALEAWSREHVAAVGDAYAAYLAERKAGRPRRYFATRSHALHFIRTVAPTKLVDGAWLYGVLPHWDNLAYRGLIRTYLEELGDGVPAQNHVALYQKTAGCA